MLVQPIYSKATEPGHPIKKTLPLSEFLELLKEEEDYWQPDQPKTKLMISRLRKIFYDQWGWNKELIRGAANIQGRYEVKIVDDPVEHGKAVRRIKDNQYQPKHRLITYRSDDRVYGDSRVGQVPFIYQNDHQEVELPEGYFCDIAHVLAGLDAWNHRQIVTPLPGFLTFLAKLFPHVDSNVDIVTWLGDIASSSGDFLFGYRRNGKRPISTEEEQDIINRDAPGSDMVGDIDPYVIAKMYEVGVEEGQRVTEIFEDYYLSDDPNSHRKKRISIFCEMVGLSDWNGEEFANERQWIHYYRKQLRDNTTFQVFSLTEEKLSSIWLPLVIWFGGFKPILKLEPLLEIWLKALKQEVKKETLNT